MTTTQSEVAYLFARAITMTQLNAQLRGLRTSDPIAFHVASMYCFDVINNVKKHGDLSVALFSTGDRIAATGDELAEIKSNPDKLAAVFHITKNDASIEWFSDDLKQLVYKLKESMLPPSVLIARAKQQFAKN